MYSIIFEACSAIDNSDVAGLMRQTYVDVVIDRWKMYTSDGVMVKAKQVMRARYNKLCSYCYEMGSGYIGFIVNAYSVGDVFFCPRCPIQDIDNRAGWERLIGQDPNDNHGSIQ